MRLRGELEQTIRTVKALAQECENLFAELTGSGRDGRGKYLDWVERCEGQLRNVFDDPRPAEGLLTERYWRVAELAVVDRQAQIIGSEIRVQVARLSGLAAELEGYRALRERPGEPCVLDTSVLLNYQVIDKVRWREVVGADPARLVIPQAVLDELDDKRYLGRADVKDRARSAVRPLDELQGQFESRGFAALSDGTTVEYLKDGGEPRHANPDEQILDRAAFLAQVTGRTVGVITGDRGMRVRATGRDGLRAILMPSRYSRDQSTGAS